MTREQDEIIFGKLIEKLKEPSLEWQNDFTHCLHQPYFASELNSFKIQVTKFSITGHMQYDLMVFKAGEVIYDKTENSTSDNPQIRNLYEFLDKKINGPKKDDREKNRMQDLEELAVLLNQ